MMKLGRAALLAMAFCTPSTAQSLPGFVAPISTAPAAVSTASLLGLPLSLEGGPWVVGDVQFHGFRDLSLYILQGKVRARRGSLYTPSDVTSDLENLRALPTLNSASAKLYAMPEQPVPDNYRAIAASTMMVRLVYNLEEKTLTLPGMTRSTAAVTPEPAEAKVPRASVSGVVLTPTAYRGVGQYNTPGMALDINLAYFIGRLYGKNSLSQHQTNFIDRLGVWFISNDAKMQIQSEAAWRPAMAVGAQGIFTLRDAPQPSIAQPGVSLNVNADTTRALGETYIVMSKKIRKARVSAGYAYGNAAERIALLTEFLSPQSLQFSQGSKFPIEAKSKDTAFASIMFMPKPSQPLALEIMKPNGMPLSPILINLKLGYFLKLNFDLSYLRFQGGWDLLGNFQFRYTQFPRTAPRGSVPSGR